jgi:hypothetical protein
MSELTDRLDQMQAELVALHDRTNQALRDYVDWLEQHLDKMRRALAIVEANPVCDCEERQP